MKWTTAQLILWGIVMTLSAGLKTNMGTEFILSFLHTTRKTSQNEQLSLTVIGKPDIMLTITSRYHGQPLVKKMDINVEKIQLPIGLGYSNFGKLSNIGIIVTASSEVSLYGHDDETGVTTEFVCLPTHSLSNKYVVVNYLPRDGCKAFFSVTAKETNTNVRIHFKIGKPGDCNGITNDDQRELIMNSLDVYGLKCTNDLTGTVVISNEVVVVMVKSFCSPMYAMEEMLLPVQYVGREYVLSAGVSGASSYRLVAVEGDAQVTVSDGSKLTIRPGHPRMLPDLDLPLCITSTKAIHVLTIVWRKKHWGRNRGTGRRHQGRHKWQKGNNGGLSVHTLQSSGQFKQDYSVNMEAKNQVRRKSRPSKTILTVIINADFYQLMILKLKKISINDRVRKRYIEGCPLMTLSVHASPEGVLRLQAMVPFGLTVQDSGGKTARASPGMLIGSIACPAHRGFVHFASNKLCLKYEKRLYVRRKAKHVCHNDGGHLVDVKSDVKENVIRKVYGRFGTLVLTGGHSYRVRGPTRRTWLWSDCSQIAQSIMTRRKGRIGRCLALFKDGWKHADCSKKTKSICEIDAETASSRDIQQGSRRIKNNCTAELDRAEEQTVTTNSKGTDVQRWNESTLSSITEHNRQLTHVTTQSMEETLFSKKHTEQFSQSKPTERPLDATAVNKSSSDSTESKASVRSDETTKQETTDIITTVGSTVHVSNVTDGTPPSKTNTSSTVSNKQANQDRLRKSNIQPKTQYAENTNSTILTTKIMKFQNTNAKPIQTRTLNMSLVRRMFLERNGKSELGHRQAFLKLVEEVKQRCHCFCRSRRLQSNSPQAVEEDRARIRQHLVVEKTTLRKTLSRKMSARDDRLSASAIGCVGVMFLLVPLVAIVVSDINTMLEKRSISKRK